MRMGAVLPRSSGMNLLRLALVAILVVVFGFGGLYAVRAQGPGDSGIAGILMAVLSLLLASGLILLGALAFSRSSGRSARLRRVDALAKLTDLRDRGALSPDEFQREKQRLLA